MANNFLFDDENPTNTIYDAKRLIGREFNDPHLQNDMKFTYQLVAEEESDLKSGKLKHFN